MLKAWLIDTVGLDADRADIIVSKLQQCGCEEVDHLAVRDAKSSIFNILDIELLEWEALALSAAIGNIILADDLLSTDPASLHPAPLTVAQGMDRALKDELMVDMAYCTAAEAALVIALKIAYHGYRVSYGIMARYCQLLGDLCQNSSIHQMALMTTVSQLTCSSLVSGSVSLSAMLAHARSACPDPDQPLLISLFHHTIRCQYTPTVVACLSAMVSLAQGNQANQMALFTAEVQDFIENRDHGLTVEEKIVSLLDHFATTPVLRERIGNSSITDRLISVLRRRHEQSAELTAQLFSLIAHLVPVNATPFLSQLPFLMDAVRTSGAVLLPCAENGLIMLTALLQEESLCEMLSVDMLAVALHLAQLYASSSDSVLEAAAEFVCRLTQHTDILLEYDLNLSQALDQLLDMITAYRRTDAMGFYFYALRAVYHVICALSTGMGYESSPSEDHASSTHHTVERKYRPVPGKAMESVLYFHLPSANRTVRVMTEVLGQRVVAESIPVQQTTLLVIELLLEDNTELWCALAANLSARHDVIHGREYMEKGPLTDPSFLLAVCEVYRSLPYLLADDSLHDNLLDLTDSLTKVLLRFIQDSMLVRELTAQDILPAACRLLAAFYSYNNLSYNIYALGCILALLQLVDAKKLNTRNRAACQLFVDLLLYYSQVYPQKATAQGKEMYLIFQYTLQCIELLAQHPIYQRDLADVKAGHITMDFLDTLDANASQPKDESSSVVHAHVHMSSLPSITPSKDMASLPSLPTPRSGVLPVLPFPCLMPDDSSAMLSPVSLVSTTTAVQSTPLPYMAGWFSGRQLSALRCLGFQVLSNLCGDPANINPLLKAGLARQAIRYLFVYALADHALSQRVLHLLITLAEFNKILLGELGVCEAIGFLLHKHAPLMDSTQTIEHVDEDLVQLSCQLVCNLCNGYQENKDRMRKCGVLMFLQLLIGKFFIFISNTARADVKDAINVIKFR